MAAPTRIKGKLLILKVDGTDYVCDATSVLLSHEDVRSTGGGADVTTFCDATVSATGSVQAWYIDVTALASTDPISLWRYLWDAYGPPVGTVTGVAFVFAPHGNTLATDDQPHFTGTCDLTGQPGIGGAANETWTFEYTFNVVGEPVLTVGV